MPYVLYTFMSIDPALLEAANKLINLGVSMAGTIHDRTNANPNIDLPAAAKAFEHVSYGIRKAILLARSLGEPPRRVAARKRIIREVEDTIQRQAEDEEEAETLQAELMDRLDSLDLEEDLGDRPVEDIIRDIIRDFGLAHIPGAHHPWKRRTPDDVAELGRQAAAPPGEWPPGGSAQGRRPWTPPEDGHPLDTS